jgi:hypothetical protein
MIGRKEASTIGSRKSASEFLSWKATWPDSARFVEVARSNSSSLEVVDDNRNYRGTAADAKT